MQAFTLCAVDEKLSDACVQVRTIGTCLDLKDFDEQIKKLADLRDRADAAEDFSPAITAEVARGKASGLYVEKVEHTGNVTIVAGTHDEDI